MGFFVLLFVHRDGGALRSLFSPYNGEQSTECSAGEVSLPTHAGFDGENAPDNAPVEEGHDHGDANQVWVHAYQATQKEKGSQCVHHTAEPNVVSRCSAQP